VLQTSDTLQSMQVVSTYLELKFKLTPKTSTLTNDSFRLYSYVGTPIEPIENMDYADLANHTEILDAFESIVLHEHYNSVARSLTLFFKDTLELLSGWYILGMDGVDQASGTAFAPEAIVFSYNQSTVADPPVGTTPTEFTIIDNSIKQDAFSTTEMISAANLQFYITSTDPEADSLFISPDYNRGRIIVNFSMRPSIAYINEDYIKVQQKKIDILPARWETIPALFQLDSASPRLYISLPAFDGDGNILEPLVYSEDGYDFFKSGYKYRIRFLGSIIAV